MAGFSQWGDALSTVLSQLLERLLQFTPTLIGAVLLLLAGWLSAWVLRALTVRGLLLIDRLLAQLSPGAAPGRFLKMPGRAATILGNVAFWIVLLFFLSAATQVLGLDTFTAWLAKVVEYLPTFIAGALIVVAGVLLSRLAGQVVEAAAISAGDRQRVLLGRIVQITILATAILVGAEQIGIKVTFLVVVAAALGVALVGAVALAVSLGARTYVANLIGSHYLRQSYSIGQRIRICGHEGKILDLNTVSVVLETAEGRVSLPAKLFHEEPIVLVVAGRDDA
jgi:small-conductance mechanosensitive channel